MKKLLSLCMVLALVLCAASAFAGGVVSLNKATAEELTNIEDIDIPQSLAESIVKYRKDHGPFKRAEDLLKVPGMTQDFWEELNPQVRNGDVIYDPDAEPALAPSKC